MKPRTILYLLLVFCSPLLLDAQTPYQVGQDISFTEVSVCDPNETPTYEPNQTTSIFEVVVDIEHDIEGPGDPDRAKNINEQCWRNFLFDVYDVNNGVETFEKTIVKHGRWLAGATQQGVFESTNTYALRPADLLENNISEGEKKVRLRVDYYYPGDTPFTLDLSILANGSLECSFPNVDGDGSDHHYCTLGTLGCFKYFDCDAVLTMQYSVALGMGGSNGIYPIYNFSPKMVGGSGLYSYEWKVINRNTELTIATGSSANFSYPNVNLLPIQVSLVVTDNESGCVYTWTDQYNKQGLFEGMPMPLELRVGPNPVAAEGRLLIEYALPSPDQVKLEVYDLSGKLVRNIAETSEMKEGLHKVELAAGSLAPGTYLVRLYAENSGQVHCKLIVQ